MSVDRHFESPFVFQQVMLTISVVIQKVVWHLLPGSVTGRIITIHLCPRKIKVFLNQNGEVWNHHQNLFLDRLHYVVSRTSWLCLTGLFFIRLPCIELRLTISGQQKRRCHLIHNYSSFCSIPETFSWNLRTNRSLKNVHNKLPTRLKLAEN